MRKFIKKIVYYFLNTVEKRDGVTLSGFSRGLQNVTFEGKNAVPDGCNFSGKIKIGYATTLGYRNLLSGSIAIGKYCQLGVDVALQDSNGLGADQCQQRQQQELDQERHVFANKRLVYNSSCNQRWQEPNHRADEKCKKDKDKLKTIWLEVRQNA